MNKSTITATHSTWTDRIVKIAQRGSIGALSRDLACSRKTLIQRFNAQGGLREVRFRRDAVVLGESMTFVFVTYDQTEALALSDRIIVMSQGRIEQIGTAREVYRRPRTRFVADFIGGPASVRARLFIRWTCAMPGSRSRSRPPFPSTYAGGAMSPASARRSTRHKRDHGPTG